MRPTAEASFTPPAEARPALGRLRCWAVWWVALFAAVSTLRSTPGAPPDPNLEYKVKAGFLLNFVKFVVWPAQAFSSPDAELVIGIVSDDQAWPVLSQALEGKTVNGHRLRVARMSEGDDPKAYRVLFVSRARKSQVDDVLKRVDTAPVLTVGEMDDFARRGGMINLFQSGDSFRFEINLQAAEAAGLSISSKLASMAKLVKPSNSK